MTLRKIHSLWMLLVLISVLGTLCACQINKGKPVNVMVVFSYDRQHAMYMPFLEEVENTLREGGYQANIRAVYMNMENEMGDFQSTLQIFHDSLAQENWKPDIMLFEGDRPARQLINEQFNHLFDFTHTPIVLGALHHPNSWANLKGHSNLARWSDPMDFCTNIDMAVKLSGVNTVEIELGSGPQDMQLREELSEQINRPPYVNNMDFHEDRLGEHDRLTTFKDSILVLVYDTQMPWKNVPKEGTEGVDYVPGKETIKSIYSYSWRYPQVVVKKDTYADMIANKSGRPQFTAVKSDFANGKGNFLAGYFATYTTIAHDVSETAIRILNGTPPSKIEMKEHKKEYMMDYQAMEKLGLDYEDYEDDYHIVNAPYPISHQNEFIFFVIVGILSILAIIVLLISVMLRLRRQIIRKDKNRLEESMYITRLCLQGADSYPLLSAADIEYYARRASQGQEKQVQELLSALKEPGEHRFKLKGDMTVSGVEEFWELRFVIRDNEEVNGLLLNINEREKQRRQMEEAIASSQESKKKENFMLKTSHEISVPLNAICEYSDLLTSGKLSADKKMELSDKISRNSEKLTEIISDILLFSRIESGRQQYFVKEVKVHPFILELMEEWKGKVEEKTGMQLTLSEGRPDVIAQVDPDRLHDIINQFLSNAIKFTEKGYIGLGWRYLLGKKQVEIFVTDTGVGIDKEKQQVAFSLFWKANDFVPGVGLGLNIAKRLAENMDGQIVISSQKGVGSKFSLILPGYSEVQ